MRSERWLLLTVIILGIAARSYQLDYSFDGDELLTVDFASGPLGPLLRHAAENTGSAPLHVLLLHAWVAVWGNSEVAARAMSLLFSAAFLILGQVWLRRMVSRPIALSVITLFALSPFFVYYGQQARPYSLAALLSVANLLAFSRLAEAPTHRGRLAVWSLLSVLLVYTLFLGALLVACEVVVALVLWKRDGRAAAVCGCVSIAALAPWMALWMSTIQPGRVPLEGISWATLPTPVNFTSFYVNLFGEVPGLQRRWLLVLLGVVGFSYVRRLVVSRHIRADELVLLLLGIGVPAFVFVMSLLMQRPFFAARHMIGSGVAFMALVGLGLATLGNGARTLLALALIGWSVAGLPNAFPANVKPPWRDVAAWIDGRYGPIRVAAEAWARLPLTHYRTESPVLLWPGIDSGPRIAVAPKIGRGEPAEAFLLVCRPDVCVRAKELESRLTLAHTWRWGYRDAADQEELRLYEISPLSDQ